MMTPFRVPPGAGDGQSPEPDLVRPRYHFLPPANWMNDPNGPIYYDGYYHLFYQHNPFADTWGNMHWGHARSRDLLNWQHLPIALRPAFELGEQHCYSGCAAVDDQGRVFLIYTSVGFDRDGICLPNQQWAALGSPDLLTWKPHPANPVLALSSHDGPAVEGDWRDPFIFREGGRIFLILGANLAETANVLLYEAVDGSLLRWHCCGILYSRPKRLTPFLECPNFVKLGAKWVLLISSISCVEYVVGDFDLETLRFTPEHEGILDPGHATAPNFYASNLLADAQGRTVLLGWGRGFPAGRGWNGCLTLPRLLSLGPDCRPRQAPLPELERLRGAVTALTAQPIHDGRLCLDRIFPAGLEVELSADGGAPLDVSLLDAQGGKPIVHVRYADGSLDVQGTVAPLPLAPGERLELRLFLDQSLLEVFAGEGRVAVTRILEDMAPNLQVELRTGPGAIIGHLAAWPLSL